LPAGGCAGADEGGGTAALLRGTDTVTILVVKTVVTSPPFAG
jgi:hypothetical protein